MRRVLVRNLLSQRRTLFRGLARVHLIHAAMLRQLARAGRRLPQLRTTETLNRCDAFLARGASRARCLSASSSNRAAAPDLPTPPAPSRAPARQPPQAVLNHHHQPPPPPPLLRSAYEPPAFVVPSVRLEFDLDPTETVVTTSLEVRRATTTSAKGSSPDLVLDGENIALRSVHVDGKPVTASVRYEGDKLTIPASVLPSAVGGQSALSSFRVDIVGSVCPQDNASGSGLYVDGGGSFMTQCEANGFRQIAFSLDRPDVLSLYDVTLRGAASRFPVLLSNGNLVSDEVDAATGRRVAVWHDPHPKPCYLFALVAGDLAHIRDAFTTRSGREVDLYMYSERKDLGDLGFAMASLKQAMAWDEARYGDCEDVLSLAMGFLVCGLRGVRCVRECAKCTTNNNNKNSKRNNGSRNNTHPNTATTTTTNHPNTPTTTQPPTTTNHTDNRPQGTASSTTWTASTWWPRTSSTWARWRTRGSTFSTPPTSSAASTVPPTRTSKTSRRSLPTSACRRLRTDSRRVAFLTFVFANHFIDSFPFFFFFCGFVPRACACDNEWYHIPVAACA